MTCASAFESTMSSVVDPMTTDTLDTNIVAHDKNIICGNPRARPDPVGGSEPDPG